MAQTFAYGGQALMEGVLMRGPDAIGVALRRPDGMIVWATEPLASPQEDSTNTSARARYGRTSSTRPGTATAAPSPRSTPPTTRRP